MYSVHVITSQRGAYDLIGHQMLDVGVFARLLQLHGRTPDKRYSINLSLRGCLIRARKRQARVFSFDSPDAKVHVLALTAQLPDRQTGHLPFNLLPKPFPSGRYNSKRLNQTNQVPA